ncbi:MAG: hypothetical protein JXR37_08335 [Kiritimatiellae bacterium]|nr:hypothetical protein [Kiritimatiellia bacterium]
MKAVCALGMTLLVSSRLTAHAQHAYFGWLSNRTETVVAVGYRSEAEINADTAPGRQPNRNVIYDPQEDAARGQLGPGVGTLGTYMKPGMWNNFFSARSGSLLFIWDVRWSEEFLRFPEQGILTHKAFQLSENASGDSRRIEIRTRFGLSGPGEVAEIDARRYIWGGDGLAQPMGADGPGGDCQTGQFTVMPVTWTRFWASVNFDTGTFSLWVADENTLPVTLFDAYRLVITTKLDNFWWEFNSSQTRTGGADAYIWFRNFVVMQDVSDPSAIVAQGARVGGGDIGDTAPPARPRGLALR